MVDKEQSWGAAVITEQKTASDGIGKKKVLVRCHTANRCRCGQEIDERAREHCPRCGTALHAH